MAQMASLLVVATVFVALWTLNIYILQSERGGGLIHETKLPMQELEPKLQGGLIREGGRICGILRGGGINFLFICTIKKDKNFSPQYSVRPGNIA